MFVTKVLLFLFLCDFSFANKLCYPVGSAREAGQKLRPRRFEICVELAWDEQRRLDVTCEFNKLTNNSLCFFVEFEQSEMIKGDRPLPTDCCSRPCKVTEKIESVKNTSELLCVVRQYSGGRSRLFTTKRIDLDASSLDSKTEEETKPVSENESSKTILKNSEELNLLSNKSVVIGGAAVAGIIIFIFSGLLFYYLNKKKLNGRTLLSGKVSKEFTMELENSTFSHTRDTPVEVRSSVLEGGGACRYCTNLNEKNTEELIYSYVSVDVLPFYEAKALAAANKKLGDRSFKPSLPDRLDATTESEYSYAQS